MSSPELYVSKKVSAEQHARDGDLVMTDLFGIARSILSQREQMDDSNTEDINVESSTPLLTPLELKDKIPRSIESRKTVLAGRNAAAEIISNPSKNSKLIVLYGGCSVHDYEGTLRFARFIKEQNDEHSKELAGYMRLMFDKPRSKFGWPGLIEDPDLDESSDKNKGLVLARELCAEITSMGVAVGMELLNPYTPQVIGDFVSMYTVGARTVESSLHRKLSALVSAPVGMKNNTAGNIQVAIDASEVARGRQMVDGYNKFGQVEQFQAKGNQNTFVILRGGESGPNYSRESLALAKAMYAETTPVGRQPVFMIDLSHGNAVNANGMKDRNQQIIAGHDVGEQIGEGDTSIIAITYEAYNKAGGQKHRPGEKHDPDLSITDECINQNQAASINATLVAAVARRRRL